VRLQRSRQNIVPAQNAPVGVIIRVLIDCPDGHTLGHGSDTELKIKKPKSNMATREYRGVAPREITLLGECTYDGLAAL
jgi:hypothetical protein